MSREGGSVVTNGVLVIRGDARTLPLPDASVDLVVTSPPYFALRSYTDGGEHYAGQIGAEPTPAEYIANLIDCTREWARVLKPTGSIFVNLGDKYSGAGPQNAPGRLSSVGNSHHWQQVGRSGIPSKSLMLLPERYRIAAVDQLGLIARAVVIWSKPNGLPESVTDRVRRSHEDWVHLTKQPRYYSAVDEIREPHARIWTPGKNGGTRPALVASRSQYDGPATSGPHPLGKLPGSVWEIATEPLKVPEHLGVDHFAAFPTEWPRRIILGWSPSGICTACGEGRRPVVASVGLDMSRPQARRAQELADRAGLTEAHFAALLSVGVSDTGRGAATQSGTGKNTPEVYALAAEARAVLGGYAREYLLRRPTGFRDGCACPDASAPTRPAVVLDPFSGTGTTVLVASALGRHGIGVDMSADYCRLAQWRVNDPAQRAKVLGVPRPPEQLEGQADLFAELEAS
jgi:DNA modification methylase